MLVKNISCLFVNKYTLQIALAKAISFLLLFLFLFSYCCCCCLHCCSFNFSTNFGSHIAHYFVALYISTKHFNVRIPKKNCIKINFQKSRKSTKTEAIERNGKKANADWERKPEILYTHLVDKYISTDGIKWKRKEKQQNEIRTILHSK